MDRHALCGRCTVGPGTSTQSARAAHPFRCRSEKIEEQVSCQNVLLLRPLRSGWRRIRELVNELLLFSLNAQLDLVQQRAANAHCVHLKLSFTPRISEHGELISHDAGFDRAVCFDGRCGVPPDPGVPAWSRWARERGLRVLEGVPLRSDEELAAAAIRAVMPRAQIDKLEETNV